MLKKCKCGYSHQDYTKIHFKRDFRGRRIAFCHICSCRINFPSVRSWEMKSIVREIMDKRAYAN